MSNDMKLIMEAWRESLKEGSQDQAAHDKASRHLARTVAGEKSRTGSSGTVFPGTDSGRRDVEARRDLELNPDDFTIKKAYDAIKTLEEEGGFWWFVVNTLDLTGVTAWPYVERSWNDYMEWYMLDDDDERKEEWLGSFLFAQFVLSVVLAIPMVDLIPKLMAKIGYEASEGLIKGILKELATAFTIFASSAGGKRLALTQSDRYNKYRHGDALNKAREKKEQLEKELKKLQRIEKDKKTIDAISRWKQKQKDRKED